MAEKKIVNLDDSAKTVVLTIGGKEFEISRITLQIRQLYGEYLTFVGNYINKMNAVNSESETASQDRLVELNKEITETIESYAIEKAKRITKILSVILEKNGYDYNKKWWEENTDYQGMESFIVSSCNKDTDDTPKKKVVEQ